MTKIFAHRGSSGYKAENTMEAFALAIAQGADGIELDVQMTADGEIVVFHDECLERIIGKKEILKYFEYAELKEMYPPLPTLGEVLDLVSETDLELNIELKTSIFEYVGIEKKVVDLVLSYGMGTRVIYSSFNHETIGRVRMLDSSARLAYLFSDIIVDAENYTKNNGVEGIHPSIYAMKMQDGLERVLHAGLDVRVWTVNEKKDMEFFIEKGVDAIFTNYPDVALKVRGK